MRNIITTLFYALLATLLLREQALYAQGADQIPKNIESQIDRIFSSFNNPNRPGAAVAVVKDGKIVFKKGYGSANLEYNIPVTPSTIFPVASLSKQFTVFSILLLADQGKLSLDDDIRKFIPEVPDFGHKITLRHLATHTSGLREEDGLLAMVGGRYDDVITTKQVLKVITNQKELNFKPGEKHLYCNTGFTLLAEVVARVSKISFAEYTQKHIFKPLGMKNSLFYDNHEKIVKNRAYSYWSNGGATKFYKGGLNDGHVGPTGLFTTIEDMSLWAMNFSNPKVGNSSIISQMNTLAKLNNGKTFGGAYGQFIQPYKGLYQIYHGGSSAGFRTYLGRFPKQKYAVIVFSNYESANANWLSMQVTDLFLKDYMSQKTSENKKEQNGYKKLKVKNLQAFGGYYWDEERFTSIKIYVKNDTLMWAIGGRRNGSPFAPINKNTFRRLSVSTDIKIKFEIEGKEKTMLIIVNNGEPIICKHYVPVSYSKEDLTQFTGTFFSEELNTSYTFLLKGGKLIAEHSRISDISFAPVKKDTFSGNQSFFKNVKYVRDASNSVVGLKVSSFQIKDLYFKKTAHNKK
ncbi:hypothetical protein BKI52_30155 [marine bacterium AO1-C]|nr:hypothetical protein BKI52_30155 [marine bacterium AO1-C]